MEKESKMQPDLKLENPKEITFGGFKYLHSSDKQYDYLFRKTDDGIKVTLQFTKDREKHEIAIKAIQTFFSWL